MNNTLYRGLICLFIGLVGLNSCSPERPIRAKGRVINRITKEPVIGAKVEMYSGYNYFSGQGDKNRNKSSTYTDENGYFELSIWTPFESADVLVSDGGNSFNIDGRLYYQTIFLNDKENKKMLFELVGWSNYQPTFVKTSGTNSETDILKFSFHYINLYSGEEDIPWERELYGKGPHTPSVSTLHSNHTIIMRLQWTTNGAWHNREYTLYLQPLLEHINDTIYY